MDPVVVAWDEHDGPHERTVSDVGLIGQLVSSLDGRDRTLVTVVRGIAHASCGGDVDAGLVLYVTLDGETFHQLVGADAYRRDEVTIVAGGQPGRYAGRFVIDGQAAATALGRFARDGDLDPTLAWEVS